MKISTLFYSKVYAQQTLDVPTSSYRTNTNSNTPIPPPSNDTPVIIMDPKQTIPNPVPTIDTSIASCKDQYGPTAISYNNTKGGCLCKDNNKEVSCTSIINSLCTTPKYSERVITAGKGSCVCTNGFVKNPDGTVKGEKDGKTECIVNKAGSVGIKCTAQDLINNTCSRNINKTLGIRSSDTTPNPTLLLQDVVLGATSFVGTIIMVALVYLGFKAVLKGADDADALGDIKGKAKNLIIGFLLVIGSYTIIRLVQYIARGF